MERWKVIERFVDAKAAGRELREEEEEEEGRGITSVNDGSGGFE